MEQDVGSIRSPNIETSHIIPNVKITVAQLQPTDRPIEDRFSVDYEAGSRRLLLGVYDGHGGPETADHISKTLPRQLLKHPPTSHSQQFVQLDESILMDFKQDHSLFRSKSSDWVHHTQLVKSGCTALILDVDLDNLLGHYSNAGDCRLVVCNSEQADNQILFQTVDLNAKNPAESERLAREHPKEDSIVVGGRLFGRLMATRGFGDGYYKLPKGLFGDSQHRKYIETISSVESNERVPMISQYSVLFYAYKTPPYITARPEFGTHQLKEGDIAILASDGLWDLVSSEEAIRIVIQGVSNNVTDLAKYLLEQVKETRKPGDDVTIVVLQIQTSTPLPTCTVVA